MRIDLPRFGKRWLDVAVDALSLNPPSSSRMTLDQDTRHPGALSTPPKHGRQTTDSHGVCVRRRPATTASIIREIEQLWDASGGALPPMDLWPCASSEHPDSQRAKARMTREIRLDVATAWRCRIVVVEYTGGVVDIGISVDRRLVGREGLLSLAQQLRGLDENGPSCVFDAGDAAEPQWCAAEFAATCDAIVPAADQWGLGGLPERRGRDRLCGLAIRASNAALLLPAIALTLARFRGGGGALVAHRREMPRGGDEMILTAGPNGEAGSVDDFVAACGAAMRGIGRHDDAAEAEMQNRRVVVDACLWFDPLRGPRRDLEGLTYEHRGVDAYRFNVDAEWTGESDICLVYDFDLASYDPTMVVRFDRSVRHMIDQISEADAALRLSGLNLMSIEDIVSDAVQGALEPSASCTSRAGISDVFHSVATGLPDAMALTFEEASFTYKELDDLTTRIAVHLRRLGVRHGDRVGVCLNRSLMIVPVLAAVLKSGATYVPIDPNSPVARQRYIADDAKLTVLLTEAELPADWNIPSVTLDDLIRDSNDILDYENLIDIVDNYEGVDQPPAYIIYTSGSTGRPKGVLIGQDSVLALIHATCDEFGLGSNDRWTFFHSAAFDFATWEIWGCLLTGGHLYVVPYLVSRSPDDFHALLRRHHITVLNQTPTAFAQLQETDRREDPDLSVRLLIFGGEPLDTRSLLPWFDRYPESRCRLINMFGITETTVHVTAETVTRRHALAASRTVGAPIPGWSVHIKDEHGRHLPRGLTGEIYVGGQGLAISYWQLPDETAKRFITDPVLGCRLYRSGDRGRLRPDGLLDHLGRVDTQVKVRGFRIELDEVRVALLEIPGVISAQVLLTFSNLRPNERQIEAFVVAPQNDKSSLRRALSKVLPDYMIPGRISILETLPITVNGKFDLDEALKLRESSTDMFSAARNLDNSVTDIDADILIIGIWEEIFGHSIKGDDNFFELGGNSLIAIQFARTMQERYRKSISVRDIYIHQTPSRLASAWLSAA